MGKVLGVYWHYAEPGDCYLGRILAGLDAMKPSFSVLPPHFILTNPMSNLDFQEAMRLMYRPIIDKWASTKQDPTGLLLRLLASVIYHFDWVCEMAASSSDHPFKSLPLMFNTELVKRLKELITVEPSVVLDRPTGIPPHVEQLVEMQRIFNVINECLTLLRQHVVDIKQVVVDASNKRNERNGQVSGARLEEPLTTFQSDILKGVDERLTRLGEGIPQPQEPVGPFEHGDVVGGTLTFLDGRFKAFCNAEDDCCVRKFWQVPKDFTFPKVNREVGWQHWLLGLPNFMEDLRDGSKVRHTIMPFRLMDPILPSKVRGAFKVNWRPIFFHHGGGHCRRRRLHGPELFEAGTELLKDRVSYCFTERSKNHLWGVSTWSQKVQPSQILKFGTDEDKASIPPHR